MLFFEGVYCMLLTNGGNGRINQGGERYHSVVMTSGTLILTIHGEQDASHTFDAATTGLIYLPAGDVSVVADGDGSLELGSVV